jgi:hypothetical protein
MKKNKPRKLNMVDKAALMTLRAGGMKPMTTQMMTSCMYFLFKARPRYRRSSRVRAFVKSYEKCLKEGTL